ncbi:MAG TPA: nitroreductase [Gammaproteobacteria bacterium]
MQTTEAMKHRHSTRAFLDKAVAKESVQAILDAARWAPSGVNTQPWRVAVVTGESRERLAEAIISARSEGVQANPDYHYYPQEWFEPYKSRRKATGLALYGALGIGREDKAQQLEAWNNNYRFFGAPVGLLIFIERRMGQGSWIDLGMFVQNILLAAEEQGLSTCPQASLADHPDIVRQQLAIEDNWALACGVALGYADNGAAVNGYRTPREPVEAFTSWHE